MDSWDEQQSLSRIEEGEKDQVESALGEIKAALRLESSPPTSEVASSNLSLGASHWKVCSYLPMPDGLQCRILTN